MRTPPYLSFLMAGLLAILQLLAPWVHAHTGGESGGILHVPGLEYLKGRSLDIGEARADWTSQDRLVTLESATEAKPLVGRSERKDFAVGPWILSRAAPLSPKFYRPVYFQSPRVSGPPLKPDIAGTSPRAPPVFNTLPRRIIQP